MMENNLTKEQKINAYEYHDENVMEFDTWRLNLIDGSPKDSIFRIEDLIFRFYSEKIRIDKINSILGDADIK